MTYIELLNSFWDSTRFNPCSSNETTMYFFLLHQCNIRRWINPFEFKTRDLELMLGFTRATISAIRNKLKQRGLIDFGKGVGSGKAVYLICGAKITDKELAEKLCVQSLNTKLNTTLNTNLNTTLNTNLNTNADSSLYIEEKRNKTKDSSPDGEHARARSPVKNGLFSERELVKTERRGVKAARVVEFSPPTMDNVRDFFLKQHADSRITDWEKEAMSFFSYYDSQGWIKSNGQKVANWESLVNDWIFRKEREKTLTKQNEQRTTYRQPTPEDTLANEQTKLAGRIMSRRSRKCDTGSSDDNQYI